jgi:hypothetical protein
MKDGTPKPLVEFIAINSINVVVNAVAEITFTPFSKISKLVPFHLIAILQVSALVVYKVVTTVEMLFIICNLVVEDGRNPIPLSLKFELSQMPHLLELSLVKLKFPLNSTNQVPPLLVIKPLV